MTLPGTSFTALVGCRVPIQQAAVGAELDPAHRSPLPPTRSFTGDVAGTALYAGTSVKDVTAVVPAAAVIEELVRDAGAALRATADR